MNKLLILVCLPLTACIITSGDDTGAFCGDAILDVGEGCDDGNNFSGDGCSASCQTETVDLASITANWTLKNVATNTTTTCPTGYDTAAVYQQPVDANGNNVGAPIIDLFNCSASTGTSTDLTPGNYLVWVAITNTNNTSTYATSTSAYVDVTTSDKTFSAEILNDGGYFQFAWTLSGDSSGNPLTCTTAGAAGGVEAVATDVADPNNSASDIFDCADGSAITAGYLAATYTVSIAALNAQDQSIGTAPSLTNRVINVRNAVTDLGTIDIPITGL